MPEGPEIRRAADKIAKVLEAKKVECVEFAFEHLKPFEYELQSREIVSLETRGKALLTHFDNGLSIYSHNQLYGRWYVVKLGKPPSTNRSLRLALHTSTHSALLYSASDIDVLDADGIAQHPFLTKIGPDILSPTLTWQEIASRLASPKFTKRSVGILYLDQAFLAGVGNYLRSEILFDANINPRARPCDLAKKQINDLARSTLKISQQAYSTGGITNAPALVKKLKQQGFRRGQYRHTVFSRENQDCYTCGETILKEAISSRRLYWCPLCQY